MHVVAKHHQNYRFECIYRLAIQIQIINYWCTVLYVYSKEYITAVIYF